MICTDILVDILSFFFYFFHRIVELMQLSLAEEMYASCLFKALLMKREKKRFSLI